MISGKHACAVSRRPAESVSTVCARPAAAEPPGAVAAAYWTRERRWAARRRAALRGSEPLGYRVAAARPGGVFSRPQVEPAPGADPPLVVELGAVITRRDVGDLLAIVARVKPIAVIAGVES
jgi:hypothetical protein